ncbi:MAG: plastocyanin/azurin family copper-binding protein [Gemmatimonadota bacterium]
MTLLQRSKVGAIILVGAIGWACGGDDGGNGGTDPTTTGTVRVTVNADGSAHQGATVRLFESGGSTASATQTTGSDGRVTFSDVPEGTHDVEIDVPTGFSLDDGETEQKSVTVTAGATANATFAIVEDENQGNVEEITAVTPSFSNPDLTISPGTTVRWINGDGVLHTVTPDGHSEWASATIASSGDTFEHTFNTTGEFAYFCDPHQAQGMTGIIRVQ